jgi:hypothetical protein
LGRRTFIAYIEAERLERFRAGVALARRCARVEEAREARAHLPDHHDALLQRCGGQPAPVGRKAAGGEAALVALEDVEARCGLEVVQDDGTLVGPYGETLTGRVEINGRISVEHIIVSVASIRGGGGNISFSDVRLNDLTKDLSCCVQDRFSTAR